MKVVINACFGGFSLSPRGLKRWAELKGRECYFYRQTAYEFRDGADRYERLELDALDGNDLFVHAFDVPDAVERGLLGRNKDWASLTSEQRDARNAEYSAHSIYHGDIPRDDPDLIRVVEELGGEHRTGASGSCAELRIVEIPDGTDYVIDEYDGNEHIAEAHRILAVLNAGSHKDVERLSAPPQIHCPHCGASCVVERQPYAVRERKVA